MFIFSKLKVYSAPINVGRAPISKEVFFPRLQLYKGLWHRAIEIG